MTRLCWLLPRSVAVSLFLSLSRPEHTQTKKDLKSLMAQVFEGVSKAGPNQPFHKLRHKTHRLDRYIQKRQDQLATRLPKDYHLKVIETADGKAYMRLFGPPIVGRNTVAFPVTGSHFKYLEPEEVSHLLCFGLPSLLEPPRHLLAESHLGPRPGAL